MKKALSYILSVVIIFTSAVSIGLNVSSVSSIDIDTFSASLFAMVLKYNNDQSVKRDAEKSMVKKANSLTEEQKKMFSSMRLLVVSERNIDTRNAVSVISGYKNIWVLQFDSVEDTVNAYDYYSHSSYVSSVEPDSVVTVSESYDSLYDTEDSMFLSWGPEYVGFDRLFEELDGQSLETVSVAVIDTGIESSHDFLKKRVDETYFNGVNKNYLKVGDTSDDNGHGTHVAGIIADCTTENVRIRPYKVLDATGAGYTSVIVAGIYRAIEDDVCAINLSLGSRNPSPIEEAAIDFAEENDVLVICAAGNQANTQPHYPACYENAIAVASVANDGQLSFFSCYGDYVDISAPGSDIVSTFLDGTYISLNGTSMATPFVTAACAMAKALHGKNTNDEIKALLYSSATMTSEMETDDRFYGYGLLQADGILGNLPENTDSYLIPSAPVLSVEGGMYKDTVEFSISNPEGNEIYYTLDGTMPNLNSLRYDGSAIVMNETATVKAAAYSKDLRKSKTVTETYYITHQLPSDEISITEAGVITACNTNLENIYLPDTIRGIVPIEIASDAFSQRNGQNQTVKTLLLPASVKEIDDEAFYENDVIERISAEGLEHIGNSAFEGCDLFESLTAPCLTEIGNSSFRYAGRYKVGIYYRYTDFQVVLPSLAHIGVATFQSSSINYFEAPNLESIGEDAFSKSRLSGVFCENLSFVPDMAFDSCQFLLEVELPHVKEIGEWAFTFCDQLLAINMPTCREIQSCAFYECGYLMNVYFPELIKMAADGFEFCYNIRVMDFPLLEEIYAVEGGGTEISLSAHVFSAPNLKSFCTGCFDGQFRFIDISGIERIDNEYFGCCETIEYLDISGCTDISSSTAFDYVDKVGLINAPALVAVNSLPNDSSIIVSSTLEDISCNLENMTFYGIPESYAEQYADENGHTFIPIPYINPESVPNVIDSKKDIEIDAIGFNLSYQWFASYDEATENTIILDGETNKAFNLKSAKKAPYYLCVVTCEENGNLYTAVTKVIHNTEYSVADYSALDDIIATIPNDLSKYSEESVSALNAVLDSIDRNLDATEQDTVDGYVEALTDAIANLKLKEYTVSFIADGETILEYDLEYAKEISMIPPAPAKEGYTFKEWLPDIPETMPAKDMSFYAVFEENKQPDDKPTEEIKPLIDIRSFEYACTIDYRTTISFTAITKDMPKDASVVWYKDGQKAGEGEKITIKEARDAFTIQAKVADKTGNVLNSTETELVKVKIDLFSRIIAFFKALFKRLPVIEQ